MERSMNPNDEEFVGGMDPQPTKTRPKLRLTSKNKTFNPRPLKCHVLLLNGEEFQVDIIKRASGQLLYERVCDHIDLLERDYFGLRYKEPSDPENIKYWLDPNKKVIKQKKRGKLEFEFALKFYPPDPTQLAESLTRYLVSLQIRRDIISGKLPCSLATHAMLGSYAVQTDLGDYDPLDHGTGIDYIQEMPFAPEQTDELLYKISELHKQHKGQTPEDAELHYLEYAKKIALYGIDLHRARDSDYVDILIGVGATGISIFRDNLRINRFVWPKILKISYRRNKFLLRIRPAEFDSYESWIAFKLPNNKMAKRLWKISVEHHSFLRLRSADDARKRTGFPRFGSKYRYSGRTLYQTRLNASMSDRPSKQFERAHSNRSLNSVLNNNRSRSQDNLSYREPYRHRNAPPDYVELERNHEQQGSPRNRAPVAPRDKFEDGRTPLQSPTPNLEPPQFPPQRNHNHQEDEGPGDSSFEDKLPSVPQDSPQEARKSQFETFRGVEKALAREQRKDDSEEDDRQVRKLNHSPRGSLSSLDMDERKTNGKPSVAPKPGKKPPVAKKPEPPKASKKDKPDKLLEVDL